MAELEVAVGRQPSPSSLPPLFLQLERQAMSSYLYAARDCMAYLAHPPPASWVVRIAATFRILALVLILPCILLTALDVASYLIVRTLGADSAHRAPKAPAIAVLAPANDDDDAAPPTSTAATGSPPVAYFAAAPAEPQLLAGEGLFSPPQSRAASPPAAAASRTAPAPAPRPDIKTAALRKRGQQPCGQP